MNKLKLLSSKNHQTIAYELIHEKVEICQVYESCLKMGSVFFLSLVSWF